MDVNEGNHRQCTSLAELSFRIDPLSDMHREVNRAVASKDVLFRREADSQASCEVSNFASSGCMVASQRNGKLRVNGNVHSWNPGEQRISGLPEKECQGQGFISRRNAESSTTIFEQKYRGRSYPRTSQELQVSQAHAQPLEEVGDDEDLYEPHMMIPNPGLYDKTLLNGSCSQKISYEEEELYPAMMHDRLMSFTQQQSLVQSPLELQFDGDSDNAGYVTNAYPISSSQLSFIAPASSEQMYKNGAEANFIDQFDHSFAGGHHDHFHARSGKAICCCNEQCCSGNPYWSWPPLGSQTCGLPMSSHQLTSPHSDPHKEIGQPAHPSCWTWPRASHKLAGPQYSWWSNNSQPLNFAHNANACYEPHACMHWPPHTPDSREMHLPGIAFMQCPPMSYEPLLSQDQFRYHMTYGRASSNLSQRAPHKLHLHHGAVHASQSYSSLSVSARNKNCPPLPGSGAAPYVLCQGCDKILQVHANLESKAAVRRIQCGACGRTSKFRNALHQYSRALFKDGLLMGASGLTHISPPVLSKPRAHSTAARIGFSEQLCLQSAVKDPVPINRERNLGSSCGLGDPHSRVDDQIFTHANGTPESNYRVMNLSTTGHLRHSTGEMLNHSSKTKWSHVTTHMLPDTSKIVHEDHHASLVNGCGVLETTSAYSSCMPEQSMASVDSVSQIADHGQARQALEATWVTDDLIQEQIDCRVRVSSGELQALTLECLPEGSHEGSPLVDSPLVEHTSNHSLPQRHDHVDGLKYASNEASCCPVPGSPLYEHLSYDIALESGEWAFLHDKKVKGGDEPSLRVPSKGSKFLSGFLMKNIREFGRGGQKTNKNWKVVVNGQMLTYATIKSAEKQAGPIRPGVYWYDYQAGFWGVMGGPCLGIIPAFIAEFNIPLVKACAGGTTGVFVNGRELHKKDLDILVGRGLPKTPGKAYMVDISGQVVDQASGQLLRSLGRLAPTIEKKGRGCGMFQPPGSRDNP